MMALIEFRGDWRAGSGDQRLNQGAEQRLSASAGIVNELEEPEIERQLFLRDAAVRPQPGSQERPEAFHGVDVDLAEPVAVLVPGVFAATMADGLCGRSRDQEAWHRWCTHQCRLWS